MRLFFGLVFCLSLLIGCKEKPLTLDESTSMKTLLKASDEQITTLVVDEAVKQMNLSAENISVEYILRDNDSKAMAVKLKIKQ